MKLILFDWLFFSLSRSLRTSITILKAILGVVLFSWIFALTCWRFFFCCFSLFFSCLSRSHSLAIVGLENSRSRSLLMHFFLLRLSFWQGNSLGRIVCLVESPSESFSWKRLGHSERVSSPPKWGCSYHTASFSFFLPGYCFRSSHISLGSSVIQNIRYK